MIVNKTIVFRDFRCGSRLLILVQENFSCQFLRFEREDLILESNCFFSFFFLAMALIIQ